MNRSEATDIVCAKNELLDGSHTSVIRLDITNGRIFDPLSGKRIEETFGYNDRESEVNLKMLQGVQNFGGVGLWLSPPNQIYDRGKILIAIKSGDQIIEYDTTGKEFSGRDYISFMIYLAQYNCGGYFLAPNLTELENVIPMPKVWEGIKNDQLEIKFNQDVEEAMHMDNPRRVYLERYGVDTNMACPVVTKKLISKDGAILEGQKLYYVKNCGQCGVMIENYIPAGYQCTNCKGVYQGCG